MKDIPEWIIQQIYKPWCVFAVRNDCSYHFVEQPCGTGLNVWIIPGTIKERNCASILGKEADASIS